LLRVLVVLAQLGMRFLCETKVLLLVCSVDACVVTETVRV